LDVDPALRRSGRFGKAVIIPEPDFTSRRDILRLHVKKVPAATGICYFRLALATVGYAFRRPEGGCGGGRVHPVEDSLQDGPPARGHTEDFVTAIKKKKSTLPPWYAQAKKQIGSQEGKDRGGWQGAHQGDGKQARLGGEGGVQGIAGHHQEEERDLVQGICLGAEHVGLYVPIPF